MGLLTPARPIQTELEAEEIVDVLEGRPDLRADDVRATATLIRGSVSPCDRLIDALHPWTSYVIVPDLRPRQRRHRAVGRRHLRPVGGARRRRRRRWSSASSSVSPRSAGSPCGSGSAASQTGATGATSSASPPSPGSASPCRCSSPGSPSTHQAPPGRRQDRHARGVDRRGARLIGSAVSCSPTARMSDRLGPTGELLTPTMTPGLRGDVDRRVGVAALVGIIVVGTIGYVVLGFAPLDGRRTRRSRRRRRSGFGGVEPLDELEGVHDRADPGGRRDRLVHPVGRARAVGRGAHRTRDREAPDGQANRRQHHPTPSCADGAGWGGPSPRTWRRPRRPSSWSTTTRNGLRDLSYAALFGDAADDDVLRRAGIERARRSSPRSRPTPSTRSITMSACAPSPTCSSSPWAREVVQRGEAGDGRGRPCGDPAAGARRGRGSPPSSSGPRVTEFLDVVMHSGGGDLLLEDVTLADDSPLVGQSLRAAQVRYGLGALVLAVHDPVTGFDHNPVRRAW